MPKRRFLTYVGRIGKTYIDPPMSMVRYRMWERLRGHPNVTFLATDYNESVAPYFQDPQRPCRRCSYGCKRCLDPAIGLQPTLGVMPRVADKAKHEYVGWLTNSTYCLVLRGDNENTRKLTEVILAGCIPVLIADMPAWPFDTRLDYRTFSFEFDLQRAMAAPEAVVDFLLAVPPAEEAAKRAALLAVRRKFFWHSDAATEGATTCAGRGGANAPSAGTHPPHCQCTRQGPRRTMRNTTIRRHNLRPSSLQSVECTYIPRVLSGVELS